MTVTHHILLVIIFLIFQTVQANCGYGYDYDCPPEPTPTCGSNEYYSSFTSSCRCLYSYERVGSSCVKKSIPTCGPNQYYSTTFSKCKCIPGTTETHVGCSSSSSGGGSSYGGPPRPSYPESKGISPNGVFAICMVLIGCVIAYCLCDGSTTPTTTSNRINIAPVHAPQKKVKKCRVLYDYQAQNKEEISITVNEELIISEKNDDGWWKGGNSRGQEGLFPGSYVEEICQPPTYSQPADVEKCSPDSYEIPGKTDDCKLFKKVFVGLLGCVCLFLIPPCGCLCILAACAMDTQEPATTHYYENDPEAAESDTEHAPYSW